MRTLAIVAVCVVVVLVRVFAIELPMRRRAKETNRDLTPRQRRGRAIFAGVAIIVLLVAVVLTNR
jgi:hypothetical protein